MKQEMTIPVPFWSALVRRTAVLCFTQTKYKYNIMGNTPKRPSRAKQSQNNLLNELPSSLGFVFAQASLVKIEKPPLKDDHIFEEHLELNFLPMEMFSLLLSFCDLHIIVNVIPQVCKALFNEVSANSGFWKMKAQREKPPGQRKLESQTWIIIYIFDKLENLKLFPVFGLQIGETSLDEMQNHPDAVLYHQNGGQYIFTFREKYRFVFCSRVFYKEIFLWAVDAWYRDRSDIPE
jgi:hypothetical protein